MNYAPIVLFTYSRADHTKAAVESLLTNVEAKDSELFIFSDGPKNERAAEGVRKNREYIHELKKLEGTRFKSVTIVEREKNWGLANSLIAGITKIIEKYGRVIVVEDDLILSPYFLKFMNDSLDKYENEDKVSAISGYCPVEGIELPETYFHRYFHCWGWATWKRSWDSVNWDTKDLLRKMRFKKNKFNIDGAYGNLYCQKVGLVDSWWVRVYASFFLAEKLTLFPGRTLVSNHGLDGTGTHSRDNSIGTDEATISSTKIEVDDIPIVENLLADKAYCKGFRTKPYQKETNDFMMYWGRLKSFIRRLLYIDCM